MGVIVADRNLSKCQAVMSAVELKAKIHDLCIRDLGIKDIERVVRQKYVYGNDPYENMPKYVLELHQSKQRLHFFVRRINRQYKSCKSDQNDLRSKV